MVEEYGNLESHYVREVYSLLASYSTKNCRSNRGLRVWRPVQKFLNDLPTGSIVIDVGCGQAKYSKKDGFVLGSDTCPEILRSIARSTTLDVQLADAVHLPYRDGSIDAALAISVIHHLSTPTRRREAVTEIARCLCVGGKLLIYVWAFEQPSGTFPSQEVLVPWHLHETSLDGRLPLVRFHHNSTKEERIIRESVAVNHTTTGATISTVEYIIGWLRKRLISSKKITPPAVPTALSQELPAESLIVSGIRRWSPMLGRKLARLTNSVEEQLAIEMSLRIVADAVVEAISCLQRVTFYRFYHLFRRGELESLVSCIPTLRIVSVDYECANWSLVAEKIDRYETVNLHD